MGNLLTKAIPQKSANIKYDGASFHGFSHKQEVEEHYLRWRTYAMDVMIPNLKKQGLDTTQIIQTILNTIKEEASDYVLNEIAGESVDVRKGHRELLDLLDKRYLPDIKRGFTETFFKNINITRTPNEPVRDFMDRYDKCKRNLDRLFIQTIKHNLTTDRIYVSQFLQAFDLFSMFDVIYKLNLDDVHLQLLLNSMGTADWNLQKLENTIRTTLVGNVGHSQRSVVNYYGAPSSSLFNPSNPPVIPSHPTQVPKFSSKQKGSITPKRKLFKRLHCRVHGNCNHTTKDCRLLAHKGSKSNQDQPKNISFYGKEPENDDTSTEPHIRLFMLSNNRTAAVSKPCNVPSTSKRLKQELILDLGDTVFGVQFVPNACPVIFDRGSPESTVGEKWLERYEQKYQEFFGFPLQVAYEKPEKSLTVCFGDGAKSITNKIAIFSVYLFGCHHEMEAYIIPNNTPLLIGADYLQRHQISGPIMMRDQELLVFHTKGFSVSFGIPQNRKASHLSCDALPPNSSQMFYGPEETATISQEVKPLDSKSLWKLHNTLGHPSMGRLRDLLKSAGRFGIDTESLLEKLYERCGYCQVGHKVERPKVRIPEVVKFNHIVGVDVFYYLSKPILHVICLGTRFSQARLLRNLTTEHVAHAFSSLWRIFGVPNILLLDRQSSFESRSFVQLCDLLGIRLEYVPTESHWTAGIVERHNSLIRSIISSLDQERPEQMVIDHPSFHDYMDHIIQIGVATKNIYINRHGFSPFQLVFGYNPKLPGLDFEQDTVDKSDNILLRPILDLQHRAQAAMTQLLSRETIDRALHSKLPKFTVAPTVGDYVLYLRGEKDLKFIRGPAQVIGFADRGNVVLKHGSSIFTESVARLRPYFKDESIEQNDIETRRKPGFLDNRIVSLMKYKSIDTSDLVAPNQEQVTNGAPENHDSQIVPHTQTPNIPAPIKKSARIAARLRAHHLSEVDHTVNNNFVHIDCYAAVIRELSRTEISQYPDDFKQSMAKELSSFRENHAFIEIPAESLPKNATVLNSRFVHTWKHTPDGQTQARSRLVILGCMEKHTSLLPKDSPLLNRTSLLILLFTSALFGFEVHHCDIPTAYLQGSTLQRELFVRPPKELCSRVFWKLRKPVYGLSDSGRYWAHRLITFMKETGGDITLDPSIWMFEQQGVYGFIGIYVDDLIYFGNQKFHLSVIQQLHKTFGVKKTYTGDFKFLGFRIIQDCTRITVHHTEYIANLFQEVPLTSRSTKQSDHQKVLDAEHEAYRSFVGKVLWVSNVRPDIAFRSSFMSMHISDPKLHHLKYAESVARYLYNNPLSLTIPMFTPNIKSTTLLVFSDASKHNIAGYKSQAGYIIFARPDDNKHLVPISWTSRCIKRVVISSLAAELLSATMAVDTAIYIKALLKSLLAKTQVHIQVFIDHLGLFHLLHSMNPTTEKRLLPDLMSLRELVDSKTIHVHYVPSEYQVADILTKEPAKKNLQRFRWIIENNHLNIPRDVVVTYKHDLPLLDQLDDKLGDPNISNELRFKRKTSEP